MPNQLPPGLKLAYTVEEACRQLGCKKTTLYLAISRRELDARKLGSRTIITGESLTRFIASRPAAEINCKIKPRLEGSSGNSHGSEPQALEKPCAAAQARSARGRKGKSANILREAE
jgi:excisionase family DNA binding protein